MQQRKQRRWRPPFQGEQCIAIQQTMSCVQCDTVLCCVSLCCALCVAAAAHDEDKGVGRPLPRGPVPAARPGPRSLFGGAGSLIQYLPQYSAAQQQCKECFEVSPPSQKRKKELFFGSAVAPFSRRPVALLLAMLPCLCACACGVCCLPVGLAVGFTRRFTVGIVGRFLVGFTVTPIASQLGLLLASLLGLLLGLLLGFVEDVFLHRSNCSSVLWEREVRVSPPLDSTLPRDSVEILTPFSFWFLRKQDTCGSMVWQSGGAGESPSGLDPSAAELGRGRGKGRGQRGGALAERRREAAQITDPHQGPLAQGTVLLSPSTSTFTKGTVLLVPSTFMRSIDEKLLMRMESRLKGQALNRLHSSTSITRTTQVCIHSSSSHRTPSRATSSRYCIEKEKEKVQAIQYPPHSSE